MQGLTTTQAQHLLKHHGLNVIGSGKKRSYLKIFLYEFNNFLTYLLISASFISFFIGNNLDGILILIVVFLNGLFGFYQEIKAEEAAKALSDMTVSLTHVIRDGKLQAIDNRLLVPDDIIVFAEGNKIPADARLIEAVNMEINEASLTGESLAVIKNIHDEIFMGTIITRGRGMAKVIKTGKKTRFGQISEALIEVKETNTPLEKKLKELSFWLGFGGIAGAFLVFLMSVFIGSSYLSSFILAVALAVAIVPEGLPVIMTITLSIGAKEMAKKKAILRKLSTIEALGSLTLIATDKTGTLTTGKMEVGEIYANNRQMLILNIILSSTTLNDPTEKALLKFVKKNEIDIESIKKEWEMIDEIPFENKTKMMSVVVKNIKTLQKHPGCATPLTRGEHSGEVFAFTKGAPESVLRSCSRILINGQEKDLTAEEKTKIEKIISNWGKKGLRILGFAYQQLQSAQADSNRLHPISTDLTFLGLIAMADNPRMESRHSVEKAHELGLKVIMITGDNPQTATSIAIATSIIKPHEKVISSQELDSLTDHELSKIIDNVKVFARTTPEQKHRIITILQKKGEVVAVTGDGVNDAIALKQADVGVAMGKIGTDVAREASDMIITDDNFATIVNAVEQGRLTLANLKKSVKYLLTTNLIEVMTVIGSLFLGIPSLFYATQILYINLVTDGIPAFALASAPKSDDVGVDPRVDLIKKGQTHRSAPTLGNTLIPHSDKIYIASIAAMGTILVLFSYYFYNFLFDAATARSAAFTVLILTQSFIFIDLWRGSVRKWIFLIGFFMPVIIHYFVITIPYLTNIFKTHSVSPLLYVVFIMLSAMILPGIKLFRINKDS